MINRERLLAVAALLPLALLLTAWMRAPSRTLAGHASSIVVVAYFSPKAT